MTFLVHTLTGVALGEITNEPIVAFGLGAGIHLIMDKIPHYWPDKLPVQLFYQAIDVILTLAVIYFVVTSKAGMTPAILFGILGSLSVDFILVNPWTFRTKFGTWHHDRQPHKPGYLYLLPDTLISLALISFILVYGAMR